MAVLYGRIFVAIRRRSKLEIWQNAAVVAGSGPTTSTESNSAGTSRRLLENMKHDDEDELDAEDVGGSSRAGDDGNYADSVHDEAASQPQPRIVVDLVQSQKLPDGHREEHAAPSNRLNADEIETAPASTLEESALSRVGRHRKCVRFLLVKQRESDSNDVDLDHIEMWSIERSHCEIASRECSDGSGLPARLMHRLRRGGPRHLRRRRSSEKPSSLSSEVKAAKQLGVIMGAFCVCFLPYFVCFVVVAVCRQCIDDHLMTAVTWIGYINSTLNPFLYPLCNRQFRISFRRMFASVQRVGAAVRASV